MTRFIMKKYLSDNSTSGRKRAGILLGILGIFFDLLLFGAKNVAGMLSGSIAVTADAFNNLADAGAHIMALVGFMLGGIRPSKRFPFGYGRLEYLSGLLVAAAILFVSGKMVISSVEKIVHPAAVDSSAAVMLILLLSIGVKWYMYRYNKYIGKRIDSAVLKAVAIDSVCDCFATAAIILSVIVQQMTGVHVDGWTGLMVAACILYAGILSAKESLAPLLGLAADEDTLDKLYRLAERYPSVLCIGDIAVHDYGPGRKLLTMRITVSDKMTDLEDLKREIRDRLGMDAVIEIKEIDSRPYNRPQSRQE